MAEPTTYTPPTLTRSQIRSNVTKRNNNRRKITKMNVTQPRTNIQPIEPILHPEYISQVPSLIRVKNVRLIYNNTLTRKGSSKGFPKKRPSVRRKQ